VIVLAFEKEIPDELKKINEALVPKPSPPQPKGLWAEFVELIGKAGVLGLAVGFIMGTYIGKVSPLYQSWSSSS
jgi:large conductance mechanosensitive channel